MALSHAAIEVTLDYSLCTMSSPAVILEAVKKTTTTDSNGQWAVDLVPNANISPANTVYSVRTPLRTFQVTVPTSSPAQASANIVNVPALPGQTTTLTGPLTVQNGPATIQGDIAARSLTLSPGSPYTPTAPAGWVQALLADNGGMVYSAKSPLFTIKGNGKILTDGAITTGTAILTSPSNALSGALAGMPVTVDGAGVAGVTLVTTILSVQSAGQVTLSANAGTSVSGARVAFATDDAAAITAAINTISANGGGALYFPPAVYGIASTVNMKSYVSVRGASWTSIINDLTGNTILFACNDVEGITIEQMRFTGTGNLGTAGRGAIWCSIGSVYGARKCRFINNWVDGVGTGGIVFDHTTDSVISGNIILNTKEHGIYVSGTSDEIAVIGNIVDGAGLGSTSGSVAGIKLASSVNRIVVSGNCIVSPLHEGILVDTSAGNTLIVGNSIRLAPLRAIRVTANGCNNITIEGNSAIQSGDVSYRIQGGTGHSIIGNYATSTVDAPQIQIDGGTSVMIAHNYLVGGAFTSWIINIVAGTDIVVHGNTIQTATNGIQIGGGATRTRIAYNFNPGTTFQFGDSGISTAIIDSYGNGKQVQAPLFSAAPNPDVSLGESYQMAALTAAVNVGNPINGWKGARIRMYWKQDGTGGRVVTYTGANWRSVGIAAQVTTLNTVTIDEAECVDGTVFRVVRLVTGQTV